MSMLSSTMLLPTRTNESTKTVDKMKVLYELLVSGVLLLYPEYPSSIPTVTVPSQPLTSASLNESPCSALPTAIDLTSDDDPFWSVLPEPESPPLQALSSSEAPATSDKAETALVLLMKCALLALSP